MNKPYPSKLTPEIISKIKELAEKPEPRHVCPVCDGGQSGELSFVVTVTEEGILYHCFRATCAKSGIVFHEPATYLSFADKIKHLGGSKSKPKTNPFPKSIKLTVPPPKKIKDLVLERWELSTEDLTRETVLYSQEKEWLVLPCRDEAELTHAVLSKKLYPNKDSSPKVIYWRHSTEEFPKLHFPKLFQNINSTCVVVEDWISAVKCCNIYPCTVSILGSQISYDQADYLRSKVGINHLIFLLDPDTWKGRETPAHRANQKLGHLFTSIDSRFIREDPKDLCYAELEAALQL